MSGETGYDERKRLPDDKKDILDDGKMKVQQGAHLSMKQIDIIRSYLQTQLPPSDLEMELFRSSQKTKSKDRKKGRFHAWVHRMAVKPGQAHVFLKSNGKIIIPKERYVSVVTECHEGDSVNHLGILATISSISSVYTFGKRNFGMTEEIVRDVIRTCKAISCRAKWMTSFNYKKMIDDNIRECKEKDILEDNAKNCPVSDDISKQRMSLAADAVRNSVYQMNLFANQGNKNISKKGNQEVSLLEPTSGKESSKKETKLSLTLHHEEPQKMETKDLDEKTNMETCPCRNQTNTRSKQAHELKLIFNVKQNEAKQTLTKSSVNRSTDSKSLSAPVLSMSSLGMNFTTTLSTSSSANGVQNLSALSSSAMDLTLGKLPSVIITQSEASINCSHDQSDNSSLSKNIPSKPILQQKRNTPSKGSKLQILSNTQYSCNDKPKLKSIQPDLKSETAGSLNVPCSSGGLKCTPAYFVVLNNVAGVARCLKNITITATSAGSRSLNNITTAATSAATNPLNNLNNVTRSTAPAYSNNLTKMATSTVTGSQNNGINATTASGCFSNISTTTTTSIKVSGGIGDQKLAVLSINNMQNVLTNTTSMTSTSGSLNINQTNATTPTTSVKVKSSENVTTSVADLLNKNLTSLAIPIAKGCSNNISSTVSTSKCFIAGKNCSQMDSANLRQLLSLTSTSKPVTIPLCVVPLNYVSSSSSCVKSDMNTKEHISRPVLKTPPKKIRIEPLKKKEENKKNYKKVVHKSKKSPSCMVTEMQADNDFTDKIECVKKKKRTIVEVRQEENQGPPSQKRRTVDGSLWIPPFGEVCKNVVKDVKTPNRQLMYGSSGTDVQTNSTPPIIGQKRKQPIGLSSGTKRKLKKKLECSTHKNAKKGKTDHGSVPTGGQRRHVFSKHSNENASIKRPMNTALSRNKKKDMARNLQTGKNASGLKNLNSTTRKTDLKRKSKVDNADEEIQNTVVLNKENMEKSKIIKLSMKKTDVSNQQKENCTGLATGISDSSSRNERENQVLKGKELLSFLTEDKEFQGLTKYVPEDNARADCDLIDHTTNQDLLLKYMLLKPESNKEPKAPKPNPLPLPGMWTYYKGKRHLGEKWSPETGLVIKKEKSCFGRLLLVLKDLQLDMRQAMLGSKIGMERLKRKLIYSESLVKKQKIFAEQNM